MPDKQDEKRSGADTGDPPGGGTPPDRVDAVARRLDAPAGRRG